MILFGERWILFGFVWSLLQGCLKGNSEDLFSHMNSNKKKKKKKKKQTKKQMNDWLRNKVVFIWDLYFLFFIFLSPVWSWRRGGARGSENRKLFINNLIWHSWQCSALWEECLFPWKSSVWKAVGQRNKKRTGIGSRVSEIQSDADPLVDFFFFLFCSHYFWTGIEGHIRQRSPSTNCPSGPRLLKRLGAGESQLKVLGVAFF